MPAEINRYTKKLLEIWGGLGDLGMLGEIDQGA